MQTVTYAKEGINVTLTVRLASTRDRIRRNAIFNALPDLAPDEGFESYVYRTHMYANCLACTEIVSTGEREITDLTPEEFLDLPDELVARWTDAVFEENPHWFPFLKRRDAESASDESTTN
jgi:hypothetical protein